MKHDVERESVGHDEDGEEYQLEVRQRHRPEHGDVGGEPAVAHHEQEQRPRQHDAEGGQVTQLLLRVELASRVCPLPEDDGRCREDEEELNPVLNVQYVGL